MAGLLEGFGALTGHVDGFEVSLTSTGNTSLGVNNNNDNGKLFWPMVANLCVTDKSGLIVVPALVSIGTNSPNYDNIVPATAIGLGVSVSLPFGPEVSPVADDEEIFFRVSQAASGTSVTLVVVPLIHGVLFLY